MVSPTHERDRSMKTRFFIAAFSIGCLLLQVPSYAQDSTTQAPATPKIEWTGLAGLVEGQFVKCKYYADAGAPMPFRPWITNMYTRLGLKATINPRFAMTIIPQIKLWNDTWNWVWMNSSNAANNPFNQHATVSLFEADASINFGSTDAIAATISAGVIPYKYNQDVKNLGEYLFRSGEHPAYIMTSFDQAYVSLTGFRVNTEISNMLSLDLFFTSETQVQPINDWSLSFLLGYKLPGYLDAGAGIMFDRLLPTVELLDKGRGDRLNTFKTSTGQLDTITWGGTKVVARLSIDPKGFLPSSISWIFGKEDGKIYGEAAILGLKSFSAYKDSTNPVNGQPVTGYYTIDSSNNYYSDIMQRIPIMIGFNVPTCKVLDYLSAELEWYGWPYSPSLYDLENFNNILPKPTGRDYKGSHWKYSFNVRKTVLGNISLIGQIARDHTRHDVYYNGNTDVNEVFQNVDEWGWWLKLQYAF
jgi:hypothetical protein